MILGAAVIFTLAFGFVWPNLWILWAGRGRIHDALPQVPACKVALVLGCAPKLTSGRDNFYFVARMVAAAQLVAAGKVERLLVSGGPLRPHAAVTTPHVSEVDCMKKALIELGVKADMIDVDPLGLRTRLSLDRARTLSSDNVLMIVSQAFHTPRAVYLAHRVGLQAHAFNAQSPRFWSKRHLRVHVRELLSRTRAFWER